jgi:hypothetical protein
VDPTSPRTKREPPATDQAQQRAALERGAWVYELRASDEPDDDRPPELKAADLRARNALCRVLEAPGDDEAKAELESAKAERDRLGELWATELFARFRQENGGTTATVVAADNAPTKDSKGRSVGRRSGAAVVMTGVEPVVAEHVKVDAYVFAEQKVVKPGEVPKLDGQLEGLYRLGERYHKARCEFEAAREHVWNAAAALPERALDAEGNRMPAAASVWRGAARPCLDAADALDACARRLGGLLGLEHLAQLATKAADAFTDTLHAHGGEHADGSCAEQRAAMLWMDAMRKLTTPERHASEGVARLRARGIEPHNAVSRVKLDARRAKDRAALRRSMFKSGPRERILVALWDASDPNALGAIGRETIWQLTMPWSSVAWLGWCAAGRGDSWSAAWDTWPMLEQFQNATIGAARGVDATAVKQSRIRAEAVEKSRSRNTAM